MFGLKTTLLTAAYAATTVLAMQGKMTFWNPHVGACGKTHADADMVVAIGKGYWTSGNPNLDPVCSKTVTITFGGKSATAAIVDKCDVCGTSNIDVSPAVFRNFGSESQGVITPVNWRIN